MIWAVFLATALFQALGASAADPSRSLAQYTHQRWSEESDTPRPVFALAQDGHGYLWMATAMGLFRFDGIHFEPITTGMDRVTEGAPSAILIRRNGEVWTNFERSRRFAIYRGGRLQLLRAPVAPDRVMAMHEARDGTIWVLTERVGLPLLRYRDGRWTSFGAAAGAPLDNPFSMVVTRDGAVWVSFTGSVMRVAPGGDRLETMRTCPQALGRLSTDPQERIWFTERRGSYPITGPGGHGSPPPLRHAYATDKAQIRGSPAFDHQGNLWIATYYGGVERVAHPDPRGAASVAEAVSSVERLTARDGLSSNATTQIFPDEEGNVWAATEGGVDRFWPATLRFEPRLTNPAAFGDLLLSASDGSVYVGETSTVYRVKPGDRPEPILRTPTEPRTLCEAPDGAIWIGLDDKEILTWKAGRIRRLPRKAPLAYTIYDCAFDSKGDYWITASFGGMARLHAGRWERMFGPANSDFLPKSLLSDAQGRIVVQWNDRTLSRLDGSVRRSVETPLDGFPPEDLTLYAAPPYAAPRGALYAAGRFGLARLLHDRFRTLSARRTPRLSGVNGMVQTADGDTWLAGASGILRVPTDGLERAFDRGGSPPIEAFGAADGLRDRPHSHSRHSIVQGGDGRLWIATQTGTQWLDPKGITRSRTPPKVAVSALVADKTYRDPKMLTLPAGSSNVQIDFSVLNFSNPRAAHVRYRIEGQDPNWIDAGLRRQAFYTNLRPGDYRFRIIADNGDGIWNHQGATVEFVVPPRFMQSNFFLGICAFLVLALLWIIYDLRMSYVAGRVGLLLEERLKERERIARELHDTLLQSIQGLLLHFQSLADRMPAQESSRIGLDAVLDRANQLISDGRERVQELRGPYLSYDFLKLIKERSVDAVSGSGVSVRVIADGNPTSIDLFVSTELLRITDEALFNVARHAKAGSVQITVGFNPRQLVLEIRDDGVGISGEMLKAASGEGRFGLIGMQERAERIGGTFSVSGRPGMGFAVTIAVPARLAFADQLATRKRLFSWLFNRKR